jgi:hypothetical protein
VEITDVLKMAEGGGNVAFVVCTFVFYKASERLARIEKALDKYISMVEAK